MLETRPCRIFFYSHLHGKYTMLPVKSLTTEYHSKKDIRIYASVWENGKRSLEKVIQVDDIKNPCILMYSSGILDINGKLIYEGDVLHVGDDVDNCERAVVFCRNWIFSADFFSKAPPISANGNTNAWWGEGWEPNLYTGRRTQTGRFRMKNIGNICENPELLGYNSTYVEKLTSIYDFYHNAE